MKPFATLAFSGVLVLLTGCQTMGPLAGAGNNLGAIATALASTGTGGGTGNDTNSNLMGAVGDMVKASSVSDAEIKQLSLNFAKQSDDENKVAPASSLYAKRLSKITSKWTEYDGMKLDFKVYLSDTVNAFALANGTIRVYSGLMDLMTDDELRFVIGHEIAHVKLGHSAATVKNAYQSSAVAKGAAAAVASNKDGSVLMNLAGEPLKDLFGKVLTSAHSREKESESDVYAVQFLKANKTNPKVAVSALMKLAKQSGARSASILATHPAPGDRAEVVTKLIAK